MYKLNKPYTDKQRADFIVEYNHQKGLTIQESDTAMYALEAFETLQGDTVIDNTEEYNQKILEQKQKQFTTQFFNTSLGYVKRKVTMQDGSIKDFLSDILPLLQTDIPIITYNEPDFTKDELPTQNTNVIVTEDFINECKQQVLIDFYGGV
jgi:hypothetical protein